MAEVQLIRLQGVKKHQNLIMIDETESKITKDLVHHPQKSLGDVPEAKRGRRNLKMAVLVMSTGLMGTWK